MVRHFSLHFLLLLQTNIEVFFLLKNSFKVYLIRTLMELKNNFNNLKIGWRRLYIPLLKISYLNTIM